MSEGNMGASAQEVLDSLTDHQAAELAALLAEVERLRGALAEVDKEARLGTTMRSRWVQIPASTLHRVRQALGGTDGR